MNIKGNIVLITGGSSGYGQAMAKAFTDEGATVIIAARHEEALRQAQAQTGAADNLVMDATSTSDWAKAESFLRSRYGRLDVLINNAGGGVAIKPFEQQTIEEIDRSISLNLSSVIYGSHTFAPMMIAQKAGTIINVASVCARECWPGWSVYGAAKAGVLNFSKGLYVDLQPYQIRVTCLIPAAANTRFNDSANIPSTPLLLKPEDVANTALFIAGLPQHAVIEDVTIWGINQIVNPL